MAENLSNDPKCLAHYEALVRRREQVVKALPQPVRDFYEDWRAAVGLYGRTAGKGTGRDPLLDFAVGLATLTATPLPPLPPDR